MKTTQRRINSIILSPAAPERGSPIGDGGQVKKVRLHNHQQLLLAVSVWSFRVAFEDFVTVFKDPGFIWAPQ